MLEVHDWVSFDICRRPWQHDQNPACEPSQHFLAFLVPTYSVHPHTLPQQPLISFQSVWISLLSPGFINGIIVYLSSLLALFTQHSYFEIYPYSWCINSLFISLCLADLLSIIWIYHDLFMYLLMDIQLASIFWPSQIKLLGTFRHK